LDFLRKNGSFNDEGGNSAERDKIGIHQMENYGEKELMGQGI
jgi:hypothetical protein